MRRKLKTGSMRIATRWIAGDGFGAVVCCHRARPRRKRARRRQVAVAVERGASRAGFCVGRGRAEKPFPSKNFRGQPVVILVAPSPDAKALRKEAARIEELYLNFSARRRRSSSRPSPAQAGRVQSNVPYAIAAERCVGRGGLRGERARRFLGDRPRPGRQRGHGDPTRCEGAQRTASTSSTTTFQTQAASPHRDRELNRLRENQPRSPRMAVGGIPGFENRSARDEHVRAVFPAKRCAVSVP